MWRDLMLGYVVIVIALCFIGAITGDLKRLLKGRKQPRQHVSQRFGVVVSRGHRTIQ